MVRKTILIPAYNASSTIGKTLLSVQQSLNTNLEIDRIYIADDFSTDETISICKNIWTHQETKMEILTAPHNRGERGNINTAIQNLHLQYDWVFIIHADDLAKKDWLKVMCKSIDSGSDRLASISSSYDVLWEDGKIDVGEEGKGEICIEGNQKSIKDTLINGTWWHISGCAISLKVLFNSGGFHPQMPQYGDMEWILRMLSQGFQIIYIPKSLTIYRQISTSVSSTSFKKHRDVYEHANLIVHYIHLFSTKEIRKLYFKFNLQLAKRNVSSVLSGNFTRLIASLKMTAYLYKLFFVNRKTDIPFNK